MNNKSFLPENILYRIDKPSNYAGGELRSYQKRLADVDVSIVLAFPDKYEVGVSNLGHRVLYERVNFYPEFYADRLYAPDIDLKELLEQEKSLLWSIETHSDLKLFDFIGFSIQYELAYPTILKMLELSNIHIYSKDRKENEPIILAGGPCCYNPLPVKDFIDAFLIGDGEDSIIEVLKLKQICKRHSLSRKEFLTKLAKIKGVYVPGYNSYVTKRICYLEKSTAPVSFPVPYSQPIHDRVVTEIRRGCGRMCRFCQPGHVNLPIRERPAKDIIDITKQTISNTGYDEYSLLSLSSNDYSNIIPVIKKLNCEFEGKNISPSLPSQRIDSFSMELTDLVQSVRKSTITLAPEAGSQKLRDTINKNISEEQIIKAILELYKKGHSKVKLYFILGLPFEEQSDLDEFLALLKKIIFEASTIRKEFNLKPLNITCSMSVFVPKPFTPFAWFAQDSLEKISEKIRYIKEQSKLIKGVKVNIHNQFISQIEAVLTRGDENICKYIYQLYKNGSYLDTWDENFSYELWKNSADEIGLNLEALACKAYPLKSKLPWDFINIGVNKNWFIEQYKLAQKAVAVKTCENLCVNCGVCKNLEAKKNIDKPYAPKIISPQKRVIKERNTEKRNIYRLIITKKDRLKFISHLDFQSTLIKLIKLTELELAYSQGFNPMAKISLGVALPLFTESETEVLDIEFLKDYDTDFVKNSLEKVFSNILIIKNITKYDKKPVPADVLCQWAEYAVNFILPLSKKEDLLYIKNVIDSSDKIFIEKKNKKGIKKQLDIKSSIKAVKLDGNTLRLALKTGQSNCLSENIPALRADVLLNTLLPNKVFKITRVMFFKENFEKI